MAERLDQHISQNEQAPHEASSFCLSLFSESGDMHTVWLPKKPDGFYRFSDDPEYSFLNVEAENGKWMLHCNRPAFFQNVAPELYQRIPVMHEQLLNIECGDRTYTLITEQIPQQGVMYTSYYLQSEIRITIGSLPSNDICCNSPFLARNHAVLTRENSTWHIEAVQAAYSVYVNNRKVDFCELKLGDMVYIMGLRILIGSNFISVSEMDGKVIISPRIIKDMSASYPRYGRYSGQAEVHEEKYYNRAPRKHIQLEEKTITVEGPPLSMERAQMPLMLRMGSSMVMGGSAALAGNFTSLLTAVLFPFLSQKYTDKQRQEYEHRRVTKYQDYLKMKQNEIQNACYEEQQLLNRKYPAIDQIISQSLTNNLLWERRPVDDDFMSLRLGSGKEPLHTVIDYPVKRFELEPDHLEEKMYQMVEKKYLLQDIPIMSSFKEDYVCGVLGQRAQTLDFVRRTIMQAAVLHSYDELKMIFLISPEELKQLDFIRYLPHVWDDMKTIRFIATDEPEAYKLGEYIKAQLPEEMDKESKLDQILKHRPYYVVFALNKKLYDSIEILKTVLQTGNNHGLTLMAVFDDLPKECVKIITLESNGTGRINYLRQNSKDECTFYQDSFIRTQAEQSMKKIANLSIKNISRAYELPKTVTFLEMFRAGRIEHLNPMKRWRENNPVKSLAAPVGVGEDGSLFTLDLHEKRQGPHGLVAGMTGSGKSEFIITYILSMAINYHPDEVAFILIDYKGGGLTGAFENQLTGMRLPHLVGTITNLDGSAIQRSLMSIESELKRRQRVFNEIKNATNEGTLDIYGYQKLYRAGKVSKPMPHLFIVSDEFAELKQQQPEFMEKLISAARIGRSLGVHLILATQKPAGVVNDQIRSNTKFRVCLRVQDKMDSMDMLKRPEAAELTDTGRFYLQVGYNEFFALGQSAWCGASYDPQDTPVVQRDDSVEFLDTTGQVIAKAKPKARRTNSGKKQIVAIVEYLSDWAKRENYAPKMLWQEPLPTELPTEELYRRYPESTGLPVRALLGIVDDPERQVQYPMVQNFQNMQNLLIVGEAGSGKSTLLQTILYSLARNYSPEAVNFYILDFSNKLLDPLKKLPHCGAYLTDEDEGTFTRFFTFISDEINRRKKLFAKADVNNYDAYLKEQRNLPLMLIAIDNIAGFSGTKVGASIATRLNEYLSDGVSYGIKYIITANFINEVNSKAKQQLGDRIALLAKDRFTYGEILGKKAAYLPSNVTGRGLCLIDGRPLEFHSAIYRFSAQEEDGEQTQNSLFRVNITKLSQQYTLCQPALKLPVLNEEETYRQFCQQFQNGRIPLGYAIQTVKPVALPLKQMFCLSVYFGNPAGIEPILRNLLHSYLIRESMELIVIKKSNGSLFEANPTLTYGAQVLDCTMEGIMALRDRMIAEAGARKVLRDDYCKIHGIDSSLPNAMELASDYLRKYSKPLMILFESFADFCNNMDAEVCEPIFSTIFQKGKGSNYYFTACFYPDDAASLTNNAVAKAFNRDKHCMILGGQFNRQGLIPLPREYETHTKISEKYNRCLMHYQGNIHPLQMPCGVLAKTMVDEDERPIF